MNLKKILFGVASGALILTPVVTSTFAADTTVVVNSANQQGWVFNPDPTNATPYEFNSDQASIGSGSLHVFPIGATPAHKFIATKPLGTLVSDINSVSYDFLIAGNGTAASANQFYLNVYTNLPSSTTFYDCRFDYVPTTGSTSSFTTALFNATDTPTNVGDRTAGGDTFVCPATLAGMPAGSTVSVIALNVGDTSTGDTGLAGYLDKVVVNLDPDTTTYDFEPLLTPGSDKNECKNGGWMTFNSPTFKNQGECVSYVQSNENAGKRN